MGPSEQATRRLLRRLKIPYRSFGDLHIPYGLFGESPPDDSICWSGTHLIIGNLCPITYIVHEISHWLTSHPDDRKLVNWGFEEQYLEADDPKYRGSVEIQQMETTACKMDMFLFVHLFDESRRATWADYINVDRAYFDEYEAFSQDLLESVDKAFLDELQSGKWKIPFGHWREDA